MAYNIENKITTIEIRITRVNTGGQLMRLKAHFKPHSVIRLRSCCKFTAELTGSITMEKREVSSAKKLTT